MADCPPLPLPQPCLAETDGGGKVGKKGKATKTELTALHYLPPALHAHTGSLLMKWQVSSVAWF